MDMKKISCAVLVVAASMSAVLASDHEVSAPAPGPGPASGSTAVTASFVGASLLSLFTFYLQ
ncbi:hypothetical protein BVC80_1743g3 [Macleaya cordata]|uniref:Arabinogalactan peptide n=1 Tax=Macleaya cordata TaxID=56857 RepID=A0A200QL76_MACCD|nr:hypothetical protein BVC80_1743g3 [Macleaya cordata]